MTVVAEMPQIAAVPSAETFIWHPLDKQYADRDTVFLLDPDYETGIAPVNGGLVTLATAETFPGASTTVTAGKFRKAITPVSQAGGGGYLSIPQELVPGAEFTVEFWMKTTGCAWSGLAGCAVVSVGGVTLSFNGAQIKAQQAHNWNGSNETATAQVSLTGFDHADGDWGHVAFTVSADNKLTLYTDGIQRVQATGLTKPGRRGGYRNLVNLIFDTANNTGSQQVTLSDLRISSKARVPGGSVTATEASIVVTSTPTGTVNQKLRGTLHSIDGASSSLISRIAGLCKVVRTDKFLNTTPIKAGGTDATHTLAGQSGAYSYDPQVIYRTLDYIYNTLGCEMYLSIDSTPQILGGGTGPYSGSDLTTKRSQFGNYNKEHPTDNVEMGKIAADVVGICNDWLTARGFAVLPYVGIWNEPNGDGFWASTDSTSYFAMYGAVASAIRAVSPTTKLGGPEADSAGESDFTTINTWMGGLINYCQTNSKPLDFISWHWYTGDIGEAAKVRQRVDQLRATYGFSSPLELIVGEGSLHTLAEVTIAGQGINLYHNDYGAGHLARRFIECQRANCVRLITTTAVDDTGTGFTAFGDLASNGHGWAALWIFQQWSMLSGTIVSHTLTGPAFLDAIATTNGSRYDVLLACLSWRKNRSFKVTVSTPAADGTPVTVYVVDDQHSNYADAGTDSLESYSAGTVLNGSVTVTLRPRSSALVRIG